MGISLVKGNPNAFQGLIYLGLCETTVILLLNFINLFKFLNNFP